MEFPSPTKTWHTTSYPSISPTRPELSVTGKAILITGGGSGLGPHIARAFATAGSTSIALVGRTLSSLETSAAALRSSFPNIKVLTFVADITDKTAIDAAFAETKDKLGPIDILISNAGYMSNAALVKDSDVTEWWKAFEINVKGNFLLAQAFLNNMAEKPIIISLTTAGAHIPAIPSLSSYAASKLAAVKLFDYIAAEYPQIRVINVHPGIMDTAMGGKGREAGMIVPFDDSRLPLRSFFECIIKDALTYLS
jgi:NAD(P)-dependent dehydrogenase (short-subunit alcohol dehydrogenase family)